MNGGSGISSSPSIKVAIPNPAPSLAAGLQPLIPVAATAGDVAVFAIAGLPIAHEAAFPGRVLASCCHVVKAGVVAVAAPSWPVAVPKPERPIF